MANGSRTELVPLEEGERLREDRLDNCFTAVIGDGEKNLKIWRGDSQGYRGRPEPIKARLTVPLILRKPS